MEFFKTSNNALVNFGNFFSSIILSPLSAQEKVSSENGVREEWAISFCLGYNDKNLGESFAWGMGKNEQIQFFNSQMYLPVILTL